MTTSNSKPAFASSLKELNRIIGEQFPKIQITKNRNYFYIYSDDRAMGLFLAGLWSTSIYCYRVSDMCIEDWKASVKRLLDNKETYGPEDQASN